MPLRIQPHSEVDRQNTSRVFSRSTHGKGPNENMNISDPWEIKKTDSGIGSVASKV